MEPSADANQAVDDAATSSQTTSAQSDMRLHPALFLVVAVVAGGVFFGVCQQIFPIHRPPEDLFIPMPPPEIAVAREAAIIQSRMLNATVALGILGLLMAGLLGTAEAAAKRFKGGALMRVAAGVALATVLGCVSGLIGHLLAEHLPSLKFLTPMARTFIVQAVMLAVFGMGVGAAVGLVVGGSRELLSRAAAGAVSGILAGLLFPIACAFLMHRVNTEIVIPGGVVGGRPELGGFALWVGVLVVAIGLIIPLVRQRTKATE